MRLAATLILRSKPTPSALCVVLLVVVVSAEMTVGSTTLVAFPLEVSADQPATVPLLGMFLFFRSVTSAQSVNPVVEFDSSPAIATLPRAQATP